MRRSKIHQLRVAHIVSWADHTLLPASQAHSCITRKDLNEVIVRLPRLQSKLWILAQQHNRQDQTGWRPPSQELQHYHRVRLWNSGEEIVSWCFVTFGCKLGEVEAIVSLLVSFMFPWIATSKEQLLDTDATPKMCVHDKVYVHRACAFSQPHHRNFSNGLFSPHGQHI